MSTVNVNEAKVHQSRWGYHPISYESSRKLRFINSVYAKAQHKAGEWERWDRKQPQNRVKRVYLKNIYGQRIRCVEEHLWEEPQIIPYFHEKIPGKTTSYYTVLGRAASLGVGEKFLKLSRQARTPQPTPQDVLPFPISEEEIDQVYQIVKTLV